MGLNFTSSDCFCPLLSALPKLECRPSPPRTLSNRSPRDVETFDEFVGRVLVDVEVVVTSVSEVDNEPSTMAFCSNSVGLMEDSEVEIGCSSANVATLVARVTDDSLVDLSLNITFPD